MTVNNAHALETTPIINNVPVKYGIKGIYESLCSYLATPCQNLP